LWGTSDKKKRRLIKKYRLWRRVMYVLEPTDERDDGTIPIDILADH